MYHCLNVRLPQTGKRHNCYVLSKGRMQFYYIPRKYSIAPLITSATNNQSWSLKIIALSLSGTSQWRQSKQQHHCPVPRSQDHFGPGQAWNLNPVYVWVGGGVAGDWVPWDAQRRLYNATFHFPPHSAEGSPPPAGQWTGETHPDEGRSRGEMTRCLPWNRLTPCCPPPFLRYETESPHTETEKINVHCLKSVGMVHLNNLYCWYSDT